MLLESCLSPDQDVSVLTFDSLHPTTPADYKTGLEGVLLELWVFLEFLAPLGVVANGYTMVPRQEPALKKPLLETGVPGIPWSGSGL